MHAMSANSEPPKRVLSSRVGISLPKHQLLCRFSPARGYCHCCGAGRGLVVCRFVYSSSAEGPEKRYRLSRHRSTILTRNGRGGGLLSQSNPYTGRQNPRHVRAQREGGAHNVISQRNDGSSLVTLFTPVTWPHFTFVSRDVAQYLAASDVLYVWQPKYSAVLCDTVKNSSAGPRTTYVEGG